MSVITNRHDDLGRAKDTECCSICKERLHYPFLHWRALEGADVFSCRHCCARNRDGLMADIVQVAAIVELQRLGVMSDYTLVRKHTATLEKRLLEQAVEERRRVLRSVDQK